VQELELNKTDIYITEKIEYPFFFYEELFTWILAPFLHLVRLSSID